MHKMKAIFANMRNRSVFWTFFFSYALLVVIPVVVTSVMIYVYIVDVIDQREEQATITEMNYFADSMDEYLQQLQGSMIKMISSPLVEKQIRHGKQGGVDPYEQTALFADLSTQLSSLLGDNANKAFLYFLDTKKLVSLEGIYDSDFFFRYAHVMEPRIERADDRLFEGLKMMDLDYMKISRKSFPDGEVQQADDYLLVMMSYPFHHQRPGAYLGVMITEERLTEMMNARQKPGRQAAIISDNGHIISKSDHTEWDADQLLQVVADRTQGSSIVKIGEVAWHMSFVKSTSTQWLYVSLIDLSVHRKPAQSVQQITMWMLVTLVIGGILIAYLLSRRMYKPIRDIHAALTKRETARTEGPHMPAAKNEFEWIKHHSHALIYQNKRMSGQIDGMLPVVQEHFIGKIIVGELSDEVAIALYAQEIDLIFTLKGSLQVICIETLFCTEAYETLSETDRSFLLIELKHAIQKRFAYAVWPCQMKENVLACIVLLEMVPAGVGEVVEFLLSITASYKIYFRTVIGVGEVVREVTKVKDSYYNAARYLKSKSFTRNNEVIGEQYETRREEPSSLESYLSREEMNRLINVLRSSDNALFLAEVRHLLQKTLDMGALAVHMHELGRDILHTIYHTAEMEQQHETVMDSYTTSMDRLYRSQSLEELMLCFEQMTARLSRSFSASADEKRQQMLAIAEYIEQHCDEELTSEFFANQMNMSLGNFSRTFKEIIGEKYVDYVSRCRMVKAKELLLGTELKVEEISIAVGYLGRNSFINMFKKMEGVTPGKYRQIYERKKEG